MRRIKPLALGLTLLFLAAGCVTMPRPITLVEEGAPAASILVAAEAPPSTRHAAEELQRFLSQMTGAEVPITSDMTYPENPVIVVGDNDWARRLLWDLDWSTLGPEEYLLRSRGRHLVIAGGEPRGTLYGVYALLEDHLGCRWFTPTVSHIPHRPDLVLPVLDERVSPRLEYREPFTLDCFDGDWAARNRMNGHSLRLEEKHGGKITYHGFVHTFDALVSPEEHFDTHPEYFALVNGARLKERTQLCTTNPDVIRMVTEKVTQWMRENPDATVFSVSQNDWYNYCECENCQAVATAEDSQIGPVLKMVNAVADAVALEFPGKAVDTLAYQWTRKPPKNLRPAPNVIVRLCSIECCFSHPFTACDLQENKDFVADMEGWAQICDRLWVWDYVTSFANYYVPFPNLHVRQPNIQFFVDHNVTGIFEQDVYNTLNGELSPLSGYLNAKLLWNPARDQQEIITEFLHGVYGPAAAPIQDYINLLQNEVITKNIHMKIWEGPDAAYLHDAILLQAENLWDDAERLVEDQPELLERVRVARLAPDFALIERLRQQANTTFLLEPGSYSVRPEPRFERAVRRFLDVAERSGVTNMRENGMTFDQYRAGLLPMLDAVTLTPIPPALGERSLRGMKPGVRWELYHGEFTDVPDFAALTPADRGVSPRVTESFVENFEKYALRFQGYFFAPADGVYTFSLNSNDGSRLWLGDTLVVDNGGAHGKTLKSGHLALSRGVYPFTLGYFQMGAAHLLEVQVSGPGIAEQVEKGGLIWHTETPQKPAKKATKKRRR